MNILKSLTIGLMLAGSLACASENAEIDILETHPNKNYLADRIFVPYREDKNLLMAPLNSHMNELRRRLDFHRESGFPSVFDGINEEILSKMIQSLDGVHYKTSQKIYKMRLEFEREVLRTTQEANSHIEKICNSTEEELEPYLE